MNAKQRAAATDLVHHIDRLCDDWAEMGPGDQRNRELWAPLFTKADVLDHALTFSRTRRLLRWLGLVS